MKWEYELMRDMLERAREYSNVQTFECMKTAALLKQAHNVMLSWDRKICDLEIAQQDLLEQCQTALASILCANESGCSTEREARKLCADALVKLNTELNKEKHN